MRHEVVCTFFEPDGARCPHNATKTAFVPHLDLYVPCCDHCGQDYEMRAPDLPEPLPPTPDPLPPEPEPSA